MRSDPSHFARLIELVCEWHTKQNSQLVCRDIYRSGPAIFPREEKIGTEIQNCRYALFFIPQRNAPKYGLDVQVGHLGVGLDK